MEKTPDDILHRNPFYVLSASPQATEEELQEALESALDRGIPEYSANEALQTLLVSRKRLAAELRWFPGVDPKTVSYSLSAIDRKDYAEALRVAGTLSEVAAATLATALLPIHPNVEETLAVLLESHRELIAPKVHALVNQDRSKAGVALAREDVVRDELRQVADEQVAAAAAVIGALAEPELLLTRLVEERIEEKDGAFSFVEKLCERLEITNQRRLKQLDSQIGADLEKLRANPQDRKAFESFLQALEKWDRILQPQQLLHESRRIDEPQSLAMLRRVREVAVELANTKGAHETALRITAALREHFPELPGAQAQLEEDQDALAELIEDGPISEALGALDAMLKDLAKKPKALVSGLGNSVFGESSRDEALDLFRVFVRAERLCRGSQYAAAPWTMVRSHAIDLHNDAEQPWAAWCLIQGLLQAGLPVSKEIAAKLHEDERACRKTLAFLHFNKALQSRNRAELERWSKVLLELEKDAEVRSSIQRAVVSANAQQHEQRLKLGGCGGLLLLLLVAGVVQDSCEKRGKRASQRAAPSQPAKQATSRYPLLPAEQPAYREYAAPLTGVISYPRFGAGEAPLRVTTRSAAGHTFAKIVEVDSNVAVVTAFIRSGETLELEMPLGAYRLRYASGRRWYGTEHLFGPETTYSEADETLRFWSDETAVHGFTIELIPRQGGNLREREISATDF